MSESGSFVNHMNTTHQAHKFTAFGHNTQSKDFDLDYEENNTHLYCFFSKNKNGNNVSSHAGDKISIRNSTIANKENSTLEKQKKSPMRTTITTIKLFDEDQPPSNIGRKSTEQQKSTLTITNKITAALSKLFKKDTIKS